MSKKVLTIITVIASLLIVIAVAPTLADDFNGNKCYDEWDWCNSGTDDQNAYWWNAGWCAAAIESGVVGGSIEGCTTSPDDHYHAPQVEHKEKSKSTDNEGDDDACSTTSKDDSCEPHLISTYIGMCNVFIGGAFYDIYDIYEVYDGYATWIEAYYLETVNYDPGYDPCDIYVA